MNWTFQVRFPPNGNDVSEWRWHSSVKHYEGPEHAAAGAAQLQAVAAINGVLLECRLTPVKQHLEGEAAADKLITSVTDTRDE